MISRGAICVLATCLSLLILASGASAQTIDVTSAADSGAGTLRDAIASAKSGDLVRIDSNVTPITLTSGSLTINKSLTITGQGARQTTIERPASAASAFAILLISSGATVNVTGVTLTGGHGGLGGAIQVEDANLSLSDAMVTGNATDGDGGGIALCGGNLTLTRGTVAGNTSNGSGGGIAAYVNCEGNNIFSITDSTIANNRAAANGGGLYLPCCATATMAHDTLLNNTAANGAGNNIDSALNAGSTVALTATIIARAPSNANGTNNCGGGAFTSGGDNLEYPGPIVLTSPLLASVAPSDCGLGTGDQVGSDPVLAGETTDAPPSNNGGPTDTYALTSGSPAIDVVPRAHCGPNDQRGLPAPDAGEAACDIGAYEVQDSTPVSVTCSPGSVLAGQAATCTATVSNPAGAIAGPPTGTVRFSTDGPGGFANGAACTLSGSGATAGCAVAYTPAAVGSGNHHITAAYGGDGAYAPGSGAGAVGVAARPTSLTVTCSLGSVPVGQTTVCAATVNDQGGGGASAPAGTVSFTSSGVGSFGGGGTCALAGSGASAGCAVTYTPGAMGSGSHTITATYGGDMAHAGSAGSMVLSVPAHGPSAASVGISCSPAVVVPGHLIQCSVAVTAAGGATSPSPTGAVAVTPAGAQGLAGGSCTLASAPGAGSCSVSFMLPRSATGTYTFAATYDGDGHYAPTSGLTSVAASPQAGVTGDVIVLSGTVVIYPKGARVPHAAAIAAARVGSFVPLKGEAVAVPTGSTIDATKGSLRLATAANYQSVTSPAYSVQTGAFAAAMFTIEQMTQSQARRHARVRHGHRTLKRPSTDLRLDTPPGAVARARCRRTRSPGKGIVRSFSGTAKGLYRTIGAASVASINGSATWIVEDRCDGTVTEVGKGRVTVTPRHGKHPSSTVVHPGQAILIKGLFR